MRPLKRKNYSHDALEEAYQSVMLKKLSAAKASKHFRVPRTTLGDKLRGKSPLKRIKMTILSEKEEDSLVSWLQDSSRRGCGRTKQQLLVAVERKIRDSNRLNPFKDGRPGKKWYACFLKRHPEITLGEARASVMETFIRSWFQKAQATLSKDGIDILNIEPHRIFNCHEIGFTFNPKTGTVLALQKEKDVYRICNDSMQQATVLACGTAGGGILKPLIVYPGQRLTFNPEEQFPESKFGSSSNGLIDTEIFYTWMKKLFVPHTKCLKKPIILFLDAHANHINLQVHEMCKQAQIVYYTLPAHTRHIMQPLDLVFFKSLKTEWRKAVAASTDVDGDRINVKKENFAIILYDAWQRAYSPVKMSKAFQAAGLSPWNPDRVHYPKGSPRTFCITSSSIATSSSTSASSKTASSLLPSSVTELSLSQSLSSANKSSSISSSSPSFTTTAPSPSSTWSPELRPQTATSSSSRENLTRLQDLKRNVDKILDFVAANKVSQNKLLQMRKLYDEQKPSAEEPLFSEFCCLYSKLVPPKATSSSSTKKGIEIQPQKHVNSERLAKVFNVSPAEKKKIEEKERRMMVTSKDDGVVPVAEVTDMEDSSTDSVASHDSFDGMCDMCHQQDNKTGWIGCDKCPAWFHKICLFKLERYGDLISKSDKELEDEFFVCGKCSGLGEM